ncbi:hypothetical protein [Teredinibacter turnerae]|uniref:hypothetical protein n=1 Tax=Teredinibacter turnerae TaxID=2426 RepID=UPI00036691EF
MDEIEHNGLPADLIQAVKSLHERLQRAADIRIEQTTENRQQGLSLEETRIALVKAESQRDESIKRTSELKDTVAELKQEDRDIRSHFDHYQQSIAEDRQQERDQFRESKQQMQAQVEALGVQLAQAQAKVAALTDANELLQEDLLKHAQSGKELQNIVSQKSNEIQSLKRELENSLQKIRKVEDERTRLTDRAEMLSDQKSGIEKEIAALAQALESTRSELKSEKNKLTNMVLR